MQERISERPNIYENVCVYVLEIPARNRVWNVPMWNDTGDNDVNICQRNFTKQNENKNQAKQSDFSEFEKFVFYKLLIY